MVDITAASYLAIVKDELGSRLMPALEPGHHQQVAMCGQYILSKLVTDARHLPALEESAMVSISKLLGTLKVLLSEGEPLVVKLETQLQSQRNFHQIEATLQIISKLLTEHADQSTAANLNKELVGIETRLHADFLKAYLEEIKRSTVVTGSKDVLSAQQLTQLTHWLHERFPGNDALEIKGIKQIPGGFSKHTIFLFLDNAKTLPDTVVVRLDWSGSAVGTTVTDEFNIIDTLFKAGIKVPQPFALEASGSVLGGPFLLVSKAEGNNPGDAFEVTNGSKIFALDLARNLARLHTVPIASFGDAVVGAKESTCDRVLREITKFEADWRALDKPSASMETAYAWLKKNIELADGPRSLIHKDPGCHNMLAHEDKLSVLLDWETAAIGNPAQDLGYVSALMMQLCDWSEFMAAYVEAGGPAVTQAQVDYYTLWGYTWVNTMVMQAQAAFEAGLVSEVRVGFAGTYLMSRAEARLRDKLYALL
jgi:aminoglycoside phosphotransferase (APT) family kinase protein